MRLDWQMSFVTRNSTFSSLVCDYLASRGRAGKEDVDLTPWSESFEPFTHVKQVHVWGTPLVLGIIQALSIEDRAPRRIAHEARIPWER